MLKKMPSRTFQKEGKWVEKPGRTLVLECSCGSKYIKTREDQTMCIRCLGKIVSVK